MDIQAFKGQIKQPKEPSINAEAETRVSKILAMADARAAKRIEMSYAATDAIQATWSWACHNHGHSHCIVPLCDCPCHDSKQPMIAHVAGQQLEFPVRRLLPRIPSETGKAVSRPVKQIFLVDDLGHTEKAYIDATGEDFDDS